MLINLKTFNGYSINDGVNYRAAVINPRTQPDASLVFIEQAKAPSSYSGMFTLGAATIPIKIKIVNQANRDALIGQLEEALRPGGSGNLVATFTDEARDYQRSCAVQSLTPLEGYRDYFILILQSGETTWKTVSAETDSWAVTTSGDTKNITVDGFSESRLNLTITPTALPAVGWAYQKLFQLPNVVGINPGTRPYCMVVDTAALVSGGKCQADCDDLLVIVDGIQVHRWIANPNNANTKVWFNLNMLPGRSLTLQTGIASSGAISEIVFQANANNYAALNALPVRGYFQHGSEWFEYRSKTVSSSGKVCKINNVTRAALGTTMQAHSTGDVFSWIQHVIYLLYGNSTATDPALNDATYNLDKPIFDLAASSNSSWVFNSSSGFYDQVNTNRPGGWQPVITRVGTESDDYFITLDGETGDPAMGMRLQTWIKNGLAKAEKATLTWLLKSSGVSITTVSVTGKKYRSGTAWPGAEAAKLERSNDLKSWFKVWFEASPSAAATWESFTRSSASITPNSVAVRLSLAGSLAAAAGISTYFEALTATVDFLSAHIPVGTLLAEKSNYLLRMSVENVNNGDRVNLQFPMLLNKALTVDGETFQVTYDGVSANRALQLDDNSREIWIRLVQGVNQLRVTGTDVGSVTIGLTWYERRR